MTNTKNAPTVAGIDPKALMDLICDQEEINAGIGLVLYYIPFLNSYKEEIRSYLGKSLEICQKLWDIYYTLNPDESLPLDDDE